MYVYQSSQKFDIGRGVGKKLAGSREVSQLVRLVIPQGPRLFEVESGRQVTWCRVPNIECDNKKFPSETVSRAR